MNRIGISSTKDKRRNINHEKLYISKARANTNRMKEFYVDFLMPDNNIKIATNMTPERYNNMFSAPLYIGQQKSLINNTKSTTKAIDLERKNRDGIFNVLFSCVTKIVILITSTIILAVLGIYKYYDIISSYICDMYKHYISNSATLNTKRFNMYKDTINNMNNYNYIKDQQIINTEIPTNSTDILIKNMNVIEKNMPTLTQLPEILKEPMPPLISNTETLKNIKNSIIFKESGGGFDALSAFLVKYILYFLLAIITILFIYLLLKICKKMFEKMLIYINGGQINTLSDSDEPSSRPSNILSNGKINEFVIFDTTISSGELANKSNKLQSNIKPLSENPHNEVKNSTQSIEISKQENTNFSIIVNKCLFDNKVEPEK